MFRKGGLYIVNDEYNGPMGDIVGCTAKILRKVMHEDFPFYCRIELGDKVVYESLKPNELEPSTRESYKIEEVI